jgi:hypothetical protein
MPKFNTKKKESKVTTNLAGGHAYQEGAEHELATVLLCSFIEDDYYRDAGATVKRIVELLDSVDPVYAAKAALFARDKFNMRSTSHVVAAELINRTAGISGISNFFRNVAVRPDDMLEILSYYDGSCAHKDRSNGKLRLPSRVKRGFRRAIEGLDRYQLAKYRGAGNDWSLVDVVNLVGPRPHRGDRDALEALVKDKLRAQGTWETELSNAKKEGVSKEDVWKHQIESGKIGYFALLRNLRNIAESCDAATLDKALGLLVEPKRIKKSRVLPFRFYTAYKQFSDPKIKAALSDALDIAVANVPDLDNSLVVVDVSGSMDAKLSGKSVLSRKEAGALMGAILAKKGKSDLMAFASDATYVEFNPRDSVLTIANEILRYNGYCGHGTCFGSIFHRAAKEYDRIVIVSDNQGWQNGSWNGYYTTQRGNPNADYANYKGTYNCDPWIYSISTSGYGTSMFSDGKVSGVSGFSEKLFDLMGMMEQDRNALVNAIKAMQF